MNALLFTALLFANQAPTKAIEPHASIVCKASNEVGKYSSFSFDLYATGHPMGGVTMFSGIFEVVWRENGMADRGHIDTLLPEEHRLVFGGQVDGLGIPTEFRLKVNTDLFHKGRTYAATLSDRISPRSGRHLGKA